MQGDISQNLRALQKYRGNCFCRHTRERKFEMDMMLQKLFKFIVCNICVFDNCLKGVGIQSLMVWNCNAVSSVRHADMFASADNFETDFTECSYCSVRRDIRKKHLRREPLPDTQWRPWSLLRSFGGMF